MHGYAGILSILKVETIPYNTTKITSLVISPPPHGNYMATPLNCLGSYHVEEGSLRSSVALFFVQSIPSPQQIIVHFVWKHNILARKQTNYFHTIQSLTRTFIPLMLCVHTFQQGLFVSMNKAAKLGI